MFYSSEFSSNSWLSLLHHSHHKNYQQYPFLNSKHSTWLKSHLCSLHDVCDDKIQYNISPHKLFIVMYAPTHSCHSPNKILISQYIVSQIVNVKKLKKLSPQVIIRLPSQDFETFKNHVPAMVLSYNHQSSHWWDNIW